MKKDNRFVLLAHWGMDFDRTQWVESTQVIGGEYKTFLSNDLKDATYRDEKEAKAWAKEILKSPGASTWKIEVMPLEKAIAFAKLGFNSIIAKTERRAEGMVGTPDCAVLDRRGNRVIVKLKSHDLQTQLKEDQ